MKFNNIVYYLLTFIFILIIPKLLIKVKEPFNIQKPYYGNNYPQNKNSMEFDILLQYWETLCHKYKIRYSLSFGTLLGQVRDKNYIPYDYDVDIMIGKEDAYKILELLDKYPNINYQGVKLSEQLESIQLIINKSVVDGTTLLSRPRFNCLGEKVTEHSDICAFNGPFARLIYQGKWIDIDLYCVTKSIKHHYKRFRKHLFGKPINKYLLYVPLNMAQTLPPTKKTEINGNPTWI